MSDPNTPLVESPPVAEVAAPQKVVETVSGSEAVEQVAEAINALPLAEDTMFVLRLFEQMDAASPMMRLVIAASIIGGSLLMIGITRFIIGRRIKRLEAIPDEKFRALRWQAQDLVPSGEMKLFWLRVWKAASWVVSSIFMLFALTGLFMSFSWSLNIAARLIVMLASGIGYIWNGFAGYLPNLITIILIVMAARYLIRLIGLVFEGIRSRRIYLKNFYPEWADTSFGIIKLMIYALTAVIIFPYLPGSSSPAFQGLSLIHI